MWRFAALMVLVVGLAPGLWLRSDLPKRPSELKLVFVRLPVPSRLADIGPFRLERAWRIESAHDRFGSYSGLMALDQGRLLAIGDRGASLLFAPPPQEDSVKSRAGMVLPGWRYPGQLRDMEALTGDPESQTYWIALESENAVLRARFRKGKLVPDRKMRPAAMANWGNNSGPESLVRLCNGSFLALREASMGWFGGREHAAVRFRSDPVENPRGEPFTLIAPEHFDPTDAAQLPDGRVLILFRRVLWPFPPQFGGALGIADPAQIRRGKPWAVEKLAEWGSELPGDNFEGLAIESGKAGRVVVWLISDDNRAVTQNTVLWRLSVDPAELPPIESAIRRPAPPSS